MKACISRIITVAVSLVCVGLLSGCDPGTLISLSAGAMNAGVDSYVMRPTHADSDLASFKLPRHVTPIDFKDGVRTIARENKFEVQNVMDMPAQSGNTVTVMLMKEHRGFTAFSRGWVITATVALKPDGKTVTISPNVRGDDGPAVEDVVKELKTGLLRKFST
ncbi:MAG: hypothetical protein ACYC6X_01670 [Minisyncoccota bacterium]